MSQSFTRLLPELQATVNACIDTALILHATTMPQVQRVMAGDAVIKDYVRALGFDDRLIPWQHLGRDDGPEPDLVLVETGRGRYRLTGQDHPCHALFATLGWTSAPNHRVAGEKLSVRGLGRLDYDAVLILEAWPSAKGESALARH